jgi:hypothetical protein
MQHSVTGGGWSAVQESWLSGVFGVAGRSGQYYRAGHWVNRASGKSTSGKRWSTTGVVVVGLLVVGAWLGLFSHGSDAQGTTPQPSATTSASPER